MDNTLKLRIIVENAPPGVVYGLQAGKGSDSRTVQNQKSVSPNLAFDFSITLRSNHAAEPDFTGLFVQGNAGNRFVYIGVGTYAGQLSSAWSGRLKVPLAGISFDMASRVVEDGSLLLQTRVPGTGRDGRPNFATVKPFAGWHLLKQDL